MMIAETAFILLCMLGAAFFSGIETGVISIHPVRLRHLLEEGSPAARTLQWFRDRSDRLLGTTLVGTNICMVIVSIMAANTASRLFPTWGKVISSGMATMLLLVFSEYLPKAWFRGRPLDRCIRFAKTLRVSYLLLRPVAAVVTWCTYWLVPRSEHDARQHRPFITREDLKALAHELDEDGVISSRERVMIHRVFELSDKTASQIMVPRAQMVSISPEASIRELVELARKTGFSRFPVHDRDRDAFAGVVNATQLLSAPPAGGGKVADHMRQAPLLKSDMPVDEILPRMRRLRQPMCLVADAESRIIGLITTEDALEEIVGKL